MAVLANFRLLCSSALIFAELAEPFTKASKAVADLACDCSSCATHSVKQVISFRICPVERASKSRKALLDASDALVYRST